MSGGGSQPTSQTVTQTTVPEYLRPYVEEMAGQARGLAQYEIESGYKPYMGQRFAGFAPMQAQAFQNVAGQQVAPQTTDASNIAFGAGTTGLAAAGQGQALGQQAGLYGGMGAEYGALGGAIGSRGVEAAEQGFGAGQAYQQMATDPSQIQSYMSPYMQNVVEAQQREAIRASEIQQQANQAQAVQQGAYGGSRQAIVEAERQRNLGTQLGDIQAAGLQKAFDTATQAQQFGANLGLQGLAQGYQGLQTGLAGTAQGISGAQTGLQGVQGAVGAGQYGLAGAQTATGAAQALGGLGGQQFEQQMAISDAMQKYGALQQQQQQQALDYQYQQYLAQQNLPYQQLAYFSDMIRGLPLSQSSTSVYGGQPDVAAQLGGLALAAAPYALRSAEGGQVKKYAGGGSVSPEGIKATDNFELSGKLRRLSDTQLAAYARVVKDAFTLGQVQNEIERRAKFRQPASKMPESTTAAEVAKRAEAASIGRPRVGMAGGGIVALAEGTRPQDDPNYSRNMPSDIGAPFQKLLEKMGQWQGIASPERVQKEMERREGVSAAQAAGPQPLGTQEEAMMEAFQPTPPAGIPTARTQPTDQEGGVDQGADLVPRGVGIDQLKNAGSNAPTASTTGGRGGQGGVGGVPRFSTFEQFRSMMPKGEISEDQRAVLNDMQERLNKQMERAGKKEDNAVYDAMLMAGLAMMGGHSFADGIARAAQMGGATYLSSKKDAEKAMDAAENAELAFRKYELEVKKGNEDSARREFGAFLDYSAQIAAIDQRGTAAALTAKSKSGTTATQENTIRSGIVSRAKELFPPPVTADPNTVAQYEQDKNNYIKKELARFGLPYIDTTAQTGTGATNNRPPLGETLKPIK